MELGFYSRRSSHVSGLEGTAGVTAISELLLSNPCLNELRCILHRLGVEAARALQPGIRVNQTVGPLYVAYCDLGDDGISLIADAL